MTREEAVYELERMKTWSKDLSDNEIEAIAIALKELSNSENPNKWISVNERLPEEEGCYLVTTNGTHNDIIDIAYYTRELWHKASRIEAWMPLPEPYKAESEG